MSLLSMRQSLATAYGTNAPYVTAFTATPATTGAATNEVTGGSFARVAANWGAVDGTAKITSGSVVLNIPAGTTVAYVGTAKTATLATADIQDTVAVTSQTFATAGTYTVTYSYQQTS